QDHGGKHGFRIFYDLIVFAADVTAGILHEGENLLQFFQYSLFMHLHPFGEAGGPREGEAGNDNPTGPAAFSKYNNQVRPSAPGAPEARNRGLAKPRGRIFLYYSNSFSPRNRLYPRPGNKSSGRIPGGPCPLDLKNSIRPCSWIGPFAYPAPVAWEPAPTWLWTCSEPISRFSRTNAPIAPSACDSAP